MISAMKKQTKKNGNFTVTEVGALIEALRSEIRPALEVIPDMQKKLNSIFEQVGTNTEKLVVLEIAVKKNIEQTVTNTEKLVVLEIAVKKNTDLTNMVLEGLKSKADSIDLEKHSRHFI